MSTTIAPGATAGPGAAPARAQTAVAPGPVPRPGNHVLVVFGAAGDLARRTLLPGLSRREAAGLLPDQYELIGSSRTAMTGEQFRLRVWPGVRQAGLAKAEPGADARPAAPQASP